MQVLKDDIRRRILDVARNEFLRHGFTKASMRVIAAKSDVGVGNLYHYYPGKDDLFRAVVAPAVSACYAMLHRNRDTYEARPEPAPFSDRLTAVLSDYTAIFNEHRPLLKLLLFKAQGSSLENFKTEFANCAALQTSILATESMIRHTKINKGTLDFLIHLHTVWMLHMFEEFLTRDICTTQMLQIVAEHIRFETAGWQAVLGA